ncbi:MAG TPA: porin [Opitutaceae bacterium]|nr:porin [Opitutaceae bacterium]
MKPHHRNRIALAALSLLAIAPASRADDAAEIKALQAQIQALQDKVNLLARKQEIADANSAAAAKALPKVSVGETGLGVASPDGGSSLHLGSLVQFDSREFLQDGGGVANNGFFLRRARIIVDGKLNQIYSYQFVPEFGNGSGGAATTVSILDANLTIAPTRALQFKFGKYKTPLGLEELQSDSYTFFTERSLVTDLEPNRDVGAQIQGSLENGALSYSLGLFNGTPDALSSSGNSDFDNDKDVVGRLFLTPFINRKDSPLQGLGFGVAASEGREKTHSAVTSGYKSDGQQTFFSYGGAVYADGEVWRFSPQAYYYAGPFGFLGEYVASAVNLRPNAPSATASPAKTQLINRAGSIAGSWVLTGEDASYAGVTPAHPFSWANGTWGAWQVAARWEQLKIDPRAFAGSSPLASPATTANEATAVGAGLSWYLNRAVRITTDFYDTRFHVTAANASTPQVLRHDEKAIDSRVQLSF